METLKECPVCGNQNRSVFLSTKDWFLTQEEFSVEQCDNCGFLFTNPRPLADNIGQYYKSEEYISHSNTNKGIISQLYKIVRGFTLKQKYDLVRQYKSGKNILDIGSGTGELLNFFKGSGWNVQGIEPDSDARNYSVQTYSIPVEDESHIFELTDNSFDVITMWHVLEHVPNLNDRIQTIRRLLKNDGILLVAVPNPESFDAKKYGEYWAAYDLPRHLYHFKKKNIKALFAKHDMNIKDIYPMKFDSFYVSMLSEKYKKGKSNLLSAFLTGLKSNSKAHSIMNYSSLIYILEKN